MDYYDRIITVGTDILFTDMNKDIRDFCTDYFIVLQYNLPGPDTITHLCNGDFIIWNSKFKHRVKKLAEADKRVRDS